MSKSTNIVKLSNGENIICNVVSDTDRHIEIESPLKMETISRVTKTGVVESLSLGKWVQPFSDQKTISLNKNLVIINLPVTIGLEKYYEYVLKKMDLGDGPSEEDLKAIEEDDICFSPAKLMHSVSQPKGDDLRITIVMNIDIEK